MAAVRTETPAARHRRNFFSKGGTGGWFAGLMVSMLVVFLALWGFSTSHQAAVQAEASTSAPAAASAQH